MKNFTYLTFFEANKNSNKFWSVEITDTNIIYKWGRVGAEGQTKVCSKTNAELNKVSKKISEKITKGYRKVEQKQTTVNFNSDNVSLFIKDLYLQSKAYFENKAGEQYTNISETVIKKGREILTKLVGLTDNAEIRYYSTMYFKTVPHKLSHKISDDEWILDDIEKIDRENKLLNDYEQNVSVVNFDTNDMKFDMTEVTADEMNYITNKVTTSVASNHHYNLKVTRAFKVNQKNAPKYDDTIGNDTHLFHGTRIENVLGILNSNLKLPNTLSGVVKTGAMFGPGLYFANNSSKSANYSFGYWSGTNRNKGYLFVTKVALGNVYKVDSARYFTAAPNGYNSVMGVKGRNLYNNEFIVYNENQAKIEYIVEVEKW